MARFFNRKQATANGAPAAQAAAAPATAASAAPTAPVASAHAAFKLTHRQGFLINLVLSVIVVAIGQFMISSHMVSRYQLSVIEQIGIYVIMAVSLNLAVGYLGQLPLGHAGFMSIGGYVGAIFIMQTSQALHLSQRAFVTGQPLAILLVVVGLILGGLAAALCGLIIGIPALRLKGDYLAIVTLGFAEIIRVFILNFDSTFNIPLTGGAKGLTGIFLYTNFINTAVVVALVLFVIHTLMKSRWGRAILAIRDNEIAAEACGINLTFHKTLAFVLSAAFAGMAGVLYAGCIGVMAPAKFGFMKSVEVLVMVVLGGMGSQLGSVVAAVGLTVLPEALRSFADLRMIVYSVVLILAMMFRPRGLFGSYDFSLSRCIERVVNAFRSKSAPVAVAVAADAAVAEAEAPAPVGTSDDAAASVAADAVHVDAQQGEED